MGGVFYVVSRGDFLRFTRRKMRFSENFFLQQRSESVALNHEDRSKNYSLVQVATARIASKTKAPHGSMRIKSWAIFTVGGFPFSTEDAALKFYRMDSDQPDWKVWDKVFEEVGRREFLFVKALYHDFYSFLGDAYDRAEPSKDLLISLPRLARSTRRTERACLRYLKVLARHFGFTVNPCEKAVGNPGDKGYGKDEFCNSSYKKNVTGVTKVLPLQLHVFYPNFLKKQKPRVAKSAQAPLPNVQSAPADQDLYSENNKEKDLSLNSSADGFEVPPHPTDAHAPTPKPDAKKPRLDAAAVIGFVTRDPAAAARAAEEYGRTRQVGDFQRSASDLTSP